MTTIFYSILLCTLFVCVQHSGACETTATCGINTVCVQNQCRCKSATDLVISLDRKHCVEKCASNLNCDRQMGTCLNGGCNCHRYDFVYQRCEFIYFKPTTRTPSTLRPLEDVTEHEETTTDTVTSSTVTRPAVTRARAAGTTRSLYYYKPCTQNRDCSGHRNMICSQSKCTCKFGHRLSLTDSVYHCDKISCLTDIDCSYYHRHSECSTPKGECVCKDGYAVKLKNEQCSENPWERSCASCSSNSACKNGTCACVDGYQKYLDLDLGLEVCRIQKYLSPNSATFSQTFNVLFGLIILPLFYFR